MGSKDLCAAAYIRDLMEIGVTSFKIEGRMKTEYYVASIVSAYRHLIDALWQKGTLSEEEFIRYRKEILKAENRNTWDGFYQGDDAGSLIFHANSDVNVNHDYLGRVVSYENGSAVLLTRNPFEKGEEIEVLSPNKENRTFRIASMRNEDGEYLDVSRHPMRKITIQVPFAVCEGDLFRRNRI